MLAYAGQGMTTDAGSSKGTQVREFLGKAEVALGALVSYTAGFAANQDSELVPYKAFMQVIGQDATAARAAVALVLAQESISSQLIDNLNASIHLRALLTDLFLIDEVLKAHKG
ncbi:MAG: hypothetical protein U0Q11_01230 [Vicinamibacterales bacterium]|mgnify:FL=1